MGGYCFKAVQPWARLLLGICAAGVVLTIVSCANEQSPPAASGPTLTPAPTATLGPTTVPEPRGGTRHFDTTWSSDRDSYLPGEPISVKFVLRSVWDKVLTVKAFPEKVALRADGTQEEIELTQGIGGAIPQEIQPGQEVEVSIEIPSSLSKTLVPGRYWVHLGGRFTDEASQGGFTIGWSNDLLFVVQHPQGAMNGAVVIGEVRDAEGLRITLETIEFTPTQTTIVASAVPRDYRPATELGPGGPPHSATAFYRLDDGPWRELRGLGNREDAEGVRLEWTLGPIPSDARTFGFRVTSFMVNPSMTVNGLWEWSVPLQTPATPTAWLLSAGVITPESLPPGEPPRPTAMPAGK